MALVFTGDILLDRGVRRRIESAGPDAVFSEDIDSVLQQANYVVGNLECPATRVKQPVFKRFIFRGEPEWLHALRRHGFTHLNLANNHSMDQGRRGLVDTWQQVDSAGMVAFGAGPTLADAVRPVLVTRTPRPIYLIASLQLKLENMPPLPHRPSVSQECVDSLAARVAALRAQEPQACIIVNLHWGWEHHREPLPQQRMEARKIINAGADAIIGHHAHCIQTIEHYRGRPIYYGIGNFIFDQQKPLNHEAIIVRMAISKEGIAFQEIPIYCNMPKVRLLR